MKRFTGLLFLSCGLFFSLQCKNSDPNSLEKENTEELPQSVTLHIDKVTTTDLTLTLECRLENKTGKQVDFKLYTPHEYSFSLISSTSSPDTLFRPIPLSAVGTEDVTLPPGNTLPLSLTFGARARKGTHLILLTCQADGVESTATYNLNLTEPLINAGWEKHNWLTPEFFPRESSELSL